MSDERWSKIDALIEASSLGTPAAKALRERTPPDVGRAIVKAAEYLGRAMDAEAERDRLRAAARDLLAVIERLGGAEDRWAELRLWPDLGDAVATMRAALDIGDVMGGTTDG